MAEDERTGETPLRGFLPPQPAGPEPDLAADRPQSQQRAGHGGFLPPEQASPPEYAEPPQTPQWAPLPTVPDNGDALAGLILSISAATLLLLSVGLSSIISVICAGLGIFYSRKGRARVDRGETPKHRGVAQAGFVTGIVALVLALLATVVWVTVAVLYATDEDFRQDLKDELEEDDDPPDGFETAIPMGLTVLRGVALLLR